MVIRMTTGTGMTTIMHTSTTTAMAMCTAIIMTTRMAISTTATAPRIRTRLA